MKGPEGGENEVKKMGEGKSRRGQFAQLFSNSNKLVRTDLIQDAWFTFVHVLVMFQKSENVLLELQSMI